MHEAPQSNTCRSRQSSHLIGRAGDQKVQCAWFHDDDVHGRRFAAHRCQRWWKGIAAQSLARRLECDGCATVCRDLIVTMDLLQADWIGLSEQPVCCV